MTPVYFGSALNNFGVRELIHVCRRRPAATRDDDIGRIEEEDSKLSVRRRRVHATGDAERTLT